MVKSSDNRQDTPKFILEAATPIVQNYWGKDTQLTPEEILPTGYKSIVLRCRLSPPSTNLPQTVIIKKFRDDYAPGWSYAPDSPTIPNVAHVCFDEWAALQLLNELTRDALLAPVLYGGDRNAGLLVMEDLGMPVGSNIEDLLSGNDMDRAVEGLLIGIESIARLHTVTMGQVERYRQIRRSLGPQPDHGPLYHVPWAAARCQPVPSEELDNIIEEYTAQFESVGLKPHIGTGEEIAQVTRQIEEIPGPFLVLCKGDQNNPVDMRYQSGIRFIDFDCAGYRHALLEGMPGRITWGCMQRIPHSVVQQMDHIYQEILLSESPMDIDGNQLHRSMVEAGAWWYIFHIVHRLPGVLEGDGMRGPSTSRQQTYARIRAFAELSEACDHLPALGASAHALATRLQDIWPPEITALPMYRVFRPD